MEFEGGFVCRRSEMFEKLDEDFIGESLSDLEVGKRLISTRVYRLCRPANSPG